MPKANVGTITLDGTELAYCEGIVVSYDAGTIEYHSGDRRDPIFVGAGNSKMTISVDCAEYTASIAYAWDTIMNNQTPVAVVLGTGQRGGGIPAATFTNCVVTSYEVTSREGDIVKARVMLMKQADS